VSHPTLVDFLGLMLGFALSQYLIYLAPLGVETPGHLPPLGRQALAFLSAPLRLTEGIVLLWPLFWLAQKIRGRTDPLTAAEWLWLFSLAGLVFTTGLVVWQGQGGMPAFLVPYAAKPRVIWYMVFVPAIAVVALVLALTGVFQHGPRPWTHSLALTLSLWPALPLAGILAPGCTLS
jgi:hypothetical protein